MKESYGRGYSHGKNEQQQHRLEAAVRTLQTVVRSNVLFPKKREEAVRDATRLLSGDISLEAAAKVARKMIEECQEAKVMRDIALASLLAIGVGVGYGQHQIIKGQQQIIEDQEKGLTQCQAQLPPQNESPNKQQNDHSAEGASSSTHGAQEE